MSVDDVAQLTRGVLKARKNSTKQDENDDSKFSIIDYLIIFIGILLFLSILFAPYIIDMSYTELLDILKNELKDIQEIINNKDESIASSLSLIMESRYNSYEIENDIAPSEIRIIELPEYSEFLLGLSNFTIVNKNIDIVQDDFKIYDDLSQMVNDIKQKPHPKVSTVLWIMNLILI